MHFINCVLIVGLWVLSATYSTISAIAWPSVLQVQEVVINQKRTNANEFYIFRQRTYIAFILSR